LLLLVLRELFFDLFLDLALLDLFFFLGGESPFVVGVLLRERFFRLLPSISLCNKQQPLE